MLDVLTRTGDLEESARRIAAEYEQPVDEVTRDMEELCAALAKRSLIAIGRPR